MPVTTREFVLAAVHFAYTYGFESIYKSSAMQTQFALNLY